MSLPRASGKFMKTRHNCHPDGKSVCGMGPRSEGPEPGTGMAVMGAVAQAGTKCKSFCLKSAPLGQPWLKPPLQSCLGACPHISRRKRGCPNCPVSKLALSTSRQTPRMGEGVLSTLTAQLLTYRQATVVSNSALQLDHFVYLLTAHYKCEVNYFAIAEV